MTTQRYINPGHYSVEENTIQPLVSIAVITYNSSDFVLETLESAKAQTYQNIELIISDDCSTDNTVEICKKWIEENKERFVRTELITTPVNTGIPANCNRALNASQGRWIKFIAGDDILVKNCIQIFIKYTEVNKDACFFSAALTPFTKNTFYKPYIENEKYFNLSSKKQLKILLTRGNFIIGASIFLNNEATKALDGFDESYKFMEDYPFYLKVYSKGYTFSYINEPIINYRLHDSNISFSVNNNYIKTLRKVRTELQPKMLLKHHLYLHYFHHMLLIKHEKLPFFISKAVMLLSPIFIIEKINILLGINKFQRININTLKNT